MPETEFDKLNRRIGHVIGELHEVRLGTEPKTTTVVGEGEFDNEAWLRAEHESLKLEKGRLMEITTVEEAAEE
jgi:hypothetical protein